MESRTLSYHSAKFGGHRYCGSANIRFFICCVTTRPEGHVTWWMEFPHQSYHPVKFGESRSYGKEDVIFPISVSIPIPISVPISMFTNVQLKNSFHTVNNIIQSSLFTTFRSEKFH